MIKEGLLLPLTELLAAASFILFFFSLSNTSFYSHLVCPAKNHSSPAASAIHLRGFRRPQESHSGVNTLHNNWMKEKAAVIAELIPPRRFAKTGKHEGKGRLQESAGESSFHRFCWCKSDLHPQSVCATLVSHPNCPSWAHSLWK